MISFITSEPKPDFSKKSIGSHDKILLSEIKTKNSKVGAFKSSLKMVIRNFDSQNKEFYGQEINIFNNPKVDRILIGVCNNLISRIEILNQNELVATREIGFMDKMSLGETQTLSIDFYDHTNHKYQGTSKISMRFYSGTGFLGDIGTLHFDLTAFGDLSGNKSIGVFAKSIDTDSFHEPEFSELKIWKDYLSFD